MSLAKIHSHGRAYNVRDPIVINEDTAATTRCHANAHVPCFRLVYRIGSIAYPGMQTIDTPAVVRGIVNAYARSWRMKLRFVHGRGMDGQVDCLYLCAHSELCTSQRSLRWCLFRLSELRSRLRYNKRSKYNWWLG